jgi:uncharacterized membrane protein (DUF485 family)
MSEDRSEETALLYAGIAAHVMKRQAALGLRVAAVFIVMIVGLPLFNQYFPTLAATPVFGFTLTWLFLGVGFFPITWLLSAYFVRESDKIESEAVRMHGIAPMATVDGGVAATGNTVAAPEEDAQ